MRSALLTATALVALSSLAVAQNQIAATTEWPPRQNQSIPMPWPIPPCPPRYGPPAAADCTMTCLAGCQQVQTIAAMNRRRIGQSQNPDSQRS
jgi:hypothetical protein